MAKKRVINTDNTTEYVRYSQGMRGVSALIEIFNSFSRDVS